MLLTKHLKYNLKDIFQNENLELDKKNKELINIKSQNPEKQNLIQLCKIFREYYWYEKIIQTIEEIDFSLMNEIYSELTTNKEIIN